MPRSAETARVTGQMDLGAARDPRANAAAVLAARRRPMSERLELALSWNAVAAELRAGMAAAIARTTPTP
jgi:hypothetical protein